MNQTHSKLLSKTLPLLGGDHTLLDQVDLVGRQDHGVGVAISRPQDLRVEAAYLTEALWIRHRVDNNEAVTFSHVLLAHRAELVLTRGVQHYSRIESRVKFQTLAHVN